MYSITRFINKGMFSLVFEAKRTDDESSGTRYAYKRVFFCSGQAPICALREKQILEVLRESIESPFLPKFYHSFLLYRTPVIVTELLSGMSLEDVKLNVGLLKEETARFYIAEILCALVQLRSLSIVHLDLKPENVMLRNSGHIVLSDFDRAFDMRTNTNGGVIQPEYFTGPAQFMAPEVARLITITTKADVWSLGILTAELIAGPVRPISNLAWERIEMAQKGEYRIANYDKLSSALKALLDSCLTYDHHSRPHASDIRKFEFFKNMNWEDVEMLRLVPPYLPTQLEFKTKSNFAASDSDILAMALSDKIPEDQAEISRHLAPLSLTALEGYGYSKEKLEEMFKDFEYEHMASDTSDSLSNEDSSVKSEKDGLN